MKDIQKSGKVLFGHQEATSYGRTWVGDKNRSDVKDVTGSHPAVIGLDFANVTTSDSERFEKAKHELITSVVGTVSTFFCNGLSFTVTCRASRLCLHLPQNGVHHTSNNTRTFTG